MKTKIWMINLLTIGLVLLVWADPGRAWWYKVKPDPEIQKLERHIKIYEELLTVVEDQKRDLERKQTVLSKATEAHQQSVDATDHAAEDPDIGYTREILAEMEEMEKRYTLRVMKLSEQLLAQQQKLKATEAVLQTTEDKLADLKQKYTALTRQEPDHQVQLQLAQKRNAVLRRENQELQQTLDQKQQYIQAFESSPQPRIDVDRCKEEIALIKRQNAALHESKLALQAEIRQKEEMIQDFQRDQANMRARSERYADQLASMREAKADLEASFRVLEGTLREKEETLEGLSDRVAEQRTRLRKKKFEVYAKENELDEIKEDLGFYRKQSDKVDLLIAAKNDAIQDLRSEVIDLREDLMAHQEMLAAKNQELRSLRQELDSSQAKVQEVLHDRARFVASLKRDLARMRH